MKRLEAIVSRRPAFWALVACLCLALFVAGQPLLHPGTTTHRNYCADNLTTFWNLWWTGRALTNGQDLFYTRMLYHPVGTSLAYTEFGPVYGALALPLTVGVHAPEGPVAASNLLTLVLFVLNAWTMFLFARWVSGSAVGGALAGFCFGFAAFQVHHVEEINLLSGYWIPLTAWVVGRAVLRGASGPAAAAAEGPGTSPAGSRPPAAAGGPGRWWWLAPLLCGFGAAGTSTTILMLVAFFLLFWLGLNLLLARDRLLPGALLRIGLSAAVLVVGSLPFTLPWLKLAAGGFTSMWPKEQAIRWSPDLLGFVVPAGSALLGGLARGFNRLLHESGGREMFLGGALLATAAVGIVARARRTAPLWGTALLAFLISLGPGLWIAGRFHPLPFSPYDLLTTAIPLLAAGRAPARFVLIVLVALGALAACAVSWLGNRQSGRRVVVGLFVLALVDTLSAPIRAVPAVIPGIYARLRDDPTPGAVLDVVVGTRSVIQVNEITFHQLAHQRPILDGPLMRPSPEASGFLQEKRIYERLADPAGIPALVDELRRIPVAYIVVQRGAAPPEVLDQIAAWFASCATVTDRSGDRIVFKLAR